MERVELDGTPYLYDNSGFGVPHNATAVTAFSVQRAIKALRSSVPLESYTTQPASDLASYEGLIWTPWRIVSRATPQALSDRLQLRSPPLWDTKQFDLYCMSGPYLDNWDSFGSSCESKITILRRIYKDLTNLTILEIGCGAGASLLRFAHYGISPYGVELDPNMILHVNPILSDRILWGDALYSLYAWNPTFFDVVFISCLGYIMSADVVKLLTDTWQTLKPGSPVLLELPKANTDVSVLDKVQYGPYIRPAQTYRAMLHNSGFTYTDTISGLLIATKTHTPLYL